MPQMVLDHETKVTLRVLIAVIALVAAPLTAGVFVVWSLKRDVNDLAREKYTMSNAAEDALREAMANPNHKVPDPRNPGIYFEVKVSQLAGSASQGARP